MICTHCHSELTVDALSCPRCGAYLSTARTAGGIRLRMVALTGVLLTIASMMLANCVLRLIPSSVSPQQQISTHPDTKSAEVHNLLMMWQKHQQPTENSTPPPPHK
jgi:hypothetical protein